MPVIPLPAWTPDQPEHGNGLIVCKNVIPVTSRSYGPAADLSLYSNALTARCQGAFKALDSSGNVNIFAGTATTLERLTSASTSWEDVTRTAGGAYGISADDFWSAAQYGLRVVMVNLTDDPQSYVIGTSTDFAALAGTPPKAKFVSVWRDFLVLAHLSTDNQKVRWSAIDDPTSWPTIGSAAAAAAQSDEQVLAGDGGAITGIVGGLGNADGAVFQEFAVWRVQYVGPPLVFTFDRVEGAKGTPAPGSIAQVGGIAFYLGEDGFNAFDGLQSAAIGNEMVDKTFFDDVDETYLSRISSAVDPIHKLVYWAYPGESHVGGVPNKILVYNWLLKRWSIIEGLNIQFLLRAATFGLNVDSAAAAIYNVDDSPFGPDSRFWAGGASTLAGFNNAHRLGFFSGTPLAASIETGDLDLAEGRRAFVLGIRPIVDTDSVTASVGYRDSQASEPTYTTATAPASDAFCPQRISSRFARAKIDIAAGVDWDEFSGFEPKVQPDGER